MAVTEIQTPNDEKAAVAAHNRRFFIADGTFFSLGSSFIDGNSVLPTYVSTLTASPLLIGLVSTLRGFGYLVPQIFVAGYIQRLPRKKPFMIATGHVMRAAAAGMALSALLARTNKVLALGIFYLCLVLTAFADGFSGLPWMDLVARTIPAETRAGLFGTMQALGGISAFAAGFLTRYLLAMETRYPLNYAMVMGLGALGLYGSLGAMHFLKEPPAREPDRIVPMGEYLRRLPEAWSKNPLFRRLILVRARLAACTSPCRSSPSTPRRIWVFPLQPLGCLSRHRWSETLWEVPCGATWGTRRSRLGNKACSGDGTWNRLSRPDSKGGVLRGPHGARLRSILPLVLLSGRSFRRNMDRLHKLYA